MSTPGSSSPSAIVRVVSYNVLSSSLSAPSHFVGVTSEKFLSPKNRFLGLTKKLDAATQQNAVVCLQEVSLAWSGKLHAYFAQKGFTFIVSNYGNRFNGYMGVGIAFPTQRYSLQAVDLACVAETKPGGWRAPKSATSEAIKSKESASALNSLFKLVRNFVFNLQRIARRVFVSSPPPSTRENQDPWSFSASRMNTLVSLRLRPIQDTASAAEAEQPAEEEDKEALDFVVSTYHMPCAFWDPSVMSIHSALAAQRVQSLAENRFPYILAGDFNFKPNSPQFALYTTNTMPETIDDPSDPEVHGKSPRPASPCFEGDSWKIELPNAMKSAYTEVQGREPAFTNLALTAGMPKSFQACLDYIFFASAASKHKGRVAKLRAVKVDDLDALCEDILTNQKLVSLPSETEYSDHLAIGADFEISSELAPRKTTTEQEETTAV